jgi:hypothetical protein
MNINQYRVGQQRSRHFGKLGAVNLAPGGQPISPQQGALQGAAAGSAFVPPIGTAVGAAIGVVIGLLSAKPNTAAHLPWAGQLLSSVNALPASAAGIGRQFAWNENSHGLAQFLEAVMATGNWLSYDGAILSNYDVCAHWAMTFSSAIIQLANAIVSNPVGTSVTLSVIESPGANVAPAPFTFTNPGVSVGPDTIARTLVMSNNGIIFALLNHLSNQYSGSETTNGLATKIFAYMLDFQFAALAPPAAVIPPSPVPNIAPAVVAAASTVNTVVAASPAPPIATTVPLPAAPPSALAPASQAPPTIIVSQAPPQFAPVAAAPSGMSDTTLLLIGGVALAAVFMMTKK